VILVSRRDAIREVALRLRFTVSIESTIDPEEMSEFLVNSWEGALMQMKPTRNMWPSEIFEKAVFDNLLGNQNKNQ
jgi:hypothetical protein